MDGRHEDYPEHLNPFREDEPKRNRLTALGRRKLRTVLNLTSWTIFPWRKSKGSDKDTSGRNRFLTMTPKLSRHIIERLSKRKPRRSASLAPTSNPDTSRSQEFSYKEFRITPRSSREKFAAREKRENALEGSYLWTEVASAPDLTVSSTSPVTQVCGDETLPGTEPRPTKQGGAKPRKKRAAPAPPAGDKHANTTETEEMPALSTPPSPLSKNIDVSLQESPPMTPSSTSDPSTTCALVHEPTPTAETTINGTVHDTSVDVVSATSHPSTPPQSPCVSVQETSVPADTNSATVQDTPLEVSSPTPPQSPRVSVQETSVPADTNSATVQDTLLEVSRPITSHQETPPPESLCVSVQETSEVVTISNTVTVSEGAVTDVLQDAMNSSHKDGKSVETCSNLPPSHDDDQKKTSTTISKL